MGGVSNAVAGLDPTTPEGRAAIVTGGQSMIPVGGGKTTGDVASEAASGAQEFLDDPLGTGEAADAARDAARTQAEAQQAALDYLKEREQIPSAFREAALGLTGQRLGLTFDPESGQIISDGTYDPISAARQNPLYQAILGTRQAGEEGILRAQSAAGSLRGGGTLAGIGSFNQQLEQQALLQAYQDQEGARRELLGLPSYAPQIAQQTAGIGQTLAQGQIAGQQAIQQGRNQLLGAGLQLGAALI